MKCRPGPYNLVVEGKWTGARKLDHREQCCDCGLVHRNDYRAVQKARNTEIEFRCWRDDKATARIRKRKGLVIISNKTTDYETMAQTLRLVQKWMKAGRLPAHTLD